MEGSFAQVIAWGGTVESLEQARERVHNAGDCVVVSRGGIDRWFVIGCPCGCGEVVQVNLDSRMEEEWRVYHKGDEVTLYPSIVRDSGCESHFIVRRGRIVGGFGGWRYEPLRRTGGRGEARVLEELTSGPLHFDEIAERLDMEPWDVYEICEALRSDGRVVGSRVFHEFGIYSLPEAE